MTKFYNDPEFKTVELSNEDVLTASSITYDSGAATGGSSGDGPELD